MCLKQVIKGLEAFPRAEEHLLQRTQSGALVSVLGLAVIVILFWHEMSYYVTTYTIHQMAVDLKRGETLPIHINMTFPSLPCDDAIDMSGKHEVDLDTNIWKLRLNRDGHILGSVYISDLVEKEQETQKDSMVFTNLLCFLCDLLIFYLHMHSMDSMVFLCQIYYAQYGLSLPNLLCTILEGSKHVNIVPTEYRYASKHVLPTNQFSVTEYFSPMADSDRTWPAVYFLYDLSPVTFTIKEERRSFLHFITRLCAVLGGTCALAGMVDRWMYRLIEAITKPKSRGVSR